MDNGKNKPQPGPARLGGSASAHSFSPEYLLAKKIIDDRALNKGVWRRCAAQLNRRPGSEPLRVLEIGAGIGTMLERAVDWGLLRGKVTYLATDADPVQTEAARDYLSSWAGNRNYRLQWQGARQGQLHAAETQITLHLRQASIEDLARVSESVGSCDLLLAHAVLDLIDIAVVLPELLSMISGGGLFYSTCNFDGATTFLPPCEGDREVIDLYHASMDRRLPGACHTGRRLLQHLGGLGMDLLASGRSDWLIEPREQNYSPEEQCFLTTILDFVEKEITLAQPPPAHSAAWLSRRRRQLSAGTLTFSAAHLDVLARTPSEPTRETDLRKQQKGHSFG